MRINIDLKDNSYPIYVENNSINSINKYLDVSRNYLIISDEKVASIYLSTLVSQFDNALSYTIGIGEHFKSMDVLLGLIDYMIDKKIDRSFTLIALGGGIVTDIVGFVASIYLRGIDFISIPTSVVSQVDSSVGGKTGVNYIYKNILGSFYHPKMILVDPMTLNTLSNREFSAGLVEIFKIFLLFDNTMVQKIVYEEYDLFEVIVKAIEYKAVVVKKDERDTSYRHCLNLGHTVGHAIEKHYHYNDMLHGEAVYTGLYFSTNKKLHKLLDDFGKRYNLKRDLSIRIADIIEYINYDKKKTGEVINFVYLDEIDKFEFVNLSIVEVVERLVDYE